MMPTIFPALVDSVPHWVTGFSESQTVLVVYDANKDLKDSSALEWALEHIASRGDYIIVLGVLHNRKTCCSPNFQLSRTLGAILGSHKRADSFPDLNCERDSLAEEVARKREVYQDRFQYLQSMCTMEGGALEVDITSASYSRKRIVAEQAKLSRPNWVILDRHLQRDREYLLEHLSTSTNLVLMRMNRKEEKCHGQVLKIGLIYGLPQDLYQAAAIADTGSLQSLSFSDPLEKLESLQCRSWRRQLSCLYSTDVSSDDRAGRAPFGGGSLESCIYGPPPARKPPRATEVPTEITPETVTAATGGIPARSCDNAPASSEAAQLVSSDLGMDTAYITLEMEPVPSDTSSAETSESSGSGEESGPEVELFEELRASMPHPRIFPGISSPQALCSTCQYKMPAFGPPRVMALEELLTATRGFSEEQFLTRAGSHTVYRGFLEDGQAVSVKRLDVEADDYSYQKFLNEINILHLAHHKNVVTLIGYCIESDERILVYEYTCNKALAWHLSPLNPGVISWNTRRKIALEVARGLCYLHEECRSGSIVHGGLGPENILLTHDYMPLIYHFADAKLQPHAEGGRLSPKSFGNPVGTPDRYLAPECTEVPTITAKADVYAFGVLLLELVTGGLCVENMLPKGQRSIVQYIRMNQDIQGYHALVDPQLENNYDMYELQCMVFAASLCIKTEVSIRPTMSKVLSMLGDYNPDRSKDGSPSPARESKVASPDNMM